jgi:hypothetical protein
MLTLLLTGWMPKQEISLIRCLTSYSQTGTARTSIRRTFQRTFPLAEHQAKAKARQRAPISMVRSGEGPPQKMLLGAVFTVILVPVIVP